jgi:hypothetical protein
MALLQNTIGLLTTSGVGTITMTSRATPTSSSRTEIWIHGGQAVFMTMLAWIYQRMSLKEELTT